MKPHGPNRVILGIWGYSSDVPEVAHHDSGAAIVIDGRIVAAMNEERITRRKNEGCWPTASIAAVLELAGLRPNEVEAVAMAGRTPLARAGIMVRELIRNGRRTGHWLPNRWLYALLTAKKIRRHGPAGFSAPVFFIGHHEAHAASAYYTAPFEEGAVVTLDGIGDSAVCGGVWSASSRGLRPIRSFSGYASIGLLYSAVTKAFGFRPARHEGKITGLAARGDASRLIEEFRSRLHYRDRHLESRAVSELFRSRVDADWGTGWIDELLDRHSREDIAAALQLHTEEIAVAIARDALADTGKTNIALAGGVFANVRVNQRIREITPGGIWIHPNMGDGGLAAGAALAIGGGRRPFEDAYLGDEPGPIPEEMVARLRMQIRRGPETPALIADAVAKGYIVGRAGGRMEYGPRALGNRTIFASADDPTINTTLNDRLRRTEFMPFAPIMTEAAAAKYLVGWRPEDHASRFMTITYNVTEAAHRDAPAVVHVDGTARPQVVAPRHGQLHRILVEYGKRTGKEIMINTSFNIHEEPIVRTAEDALRSLEEGAVDAVAIEETLLAPPAILARLEA
jgi:carbamoyltransferase